MWVDTYTMITSVIKNAVFIYGKDVALRIPEDQTPYQ
jgi:hypothetical protein